MSRLVDAALLSFPVAQAELQECEALISLMRNDDSVDAPEHVIARALRLMQPPTPAPQGEIVRRFIATLLGDSWQTPLAFGLRSDARMLVDAGERQRAALLEEHAALAGVALAIAIKDICYATWDSDPSQAAGAAAALNLLAERTGDPEIHALATWTSGIAALATGRMDRAIDLLDAAVEQFHCLGQPHTAARVEVGKSMALAMLGRYDDAVACGIAARDALLVHGDEITAGRIELNLGHIALRRDRYAEAEQWYLPLMRVFSLLKNRHR